MPKEINFEPPFAAYYCKHCDSILQRQSDKAWIKSYCEKSGRDVHLMRVK